MKLFFGLSVALNLLEFITQREGSKSPRGTGQISGGGVQLLPEPQQGAPLRAIACFDQSSDHCSD